MEPDRFKRVRLLFDLAVETSPDDVEELLAAHAAGDVNLIVEVKRLLEAHRAASGFLSGAAIKSRTTDSAARSAVACFDSALPSGTRIGVYEVRSMLGAGGMGEVYCGTDTRLDRPVALKILRAAEHENIERVRRFEHEARAASALNHPNIVTIYDIAESEQGRVIAMELVQGQTLRELIGQRPAIEIVTHVGRQIAQALRVAHDAGIVHRDIKPENIMVRADGYVKVLDFGVARLVRSTDAEATVAAPAAGIFGTLRYMSPEQSRGEEIAGASDIFSLGLVLYELTTGDHPFQVNPHSQLSTRSEHMRSRRRRL